MAKTKVSKGKVHDIIWDGGTACLRWRDNHWAMDVTPRGGERIRKSTKQWDLKEANKVIQKTIGELTRGEYVPPTPADNVTVTDIISEYLEVFKNKWKPSTLTNYRGQADNFLIPYFGRYKPSEVTAETIIAYRRKRLQDPRLTGKNRVKDGERVPEGYDIGTVSDVTIDRELALLRAVYNWKHGINKAIVPDVPTFTILNIDNVRTGFIDINEFEEKLLPRLPEHTKALCYAAVLWGGRRSEWLQLDWTDIDFDNEVIHFNETKANVPREIPLPNGSLLFQLFQQLFERHKVLCPDEPAVFTYDGRRLSAIKRSWKTATKGAGMQGIVFHDTRRSASKIQRDAGMTQGMIMRNMGHRTDKMFHRYGIAGTEDLKVSNQLMTEYLKKRKAS
jgi:integrase